LLHPRVSHETREVIAYPLFLIFKKTISVATLSSDWKLAEVTAIHKKKIKIRQRKLYTSQFNEHMLKDPRVIYQGSYYVLSMG